MTQFKPSRRKRPCKNLATEFRIYDSFGNLIHKAKRRFTLKDRWKRFLAQQQTLSRMKTQGRSSAEVLDNGVTFYFVFRNGKALVPDTRFLGDLG